MFERIATAGRVAGYDLLILAAAVIVSGVGDLAARPGFRLGWGRFPDGAEVLCLHDRDGGGFGDAVNPTAPDCSEWGYAPFAGGA